MGLVYWNLCLYPIFFFRTSNNLQQIALALSLMLESLAEVKVLSAVGLTADGVCLLGSLFVAIFVAVYTIDWTKIGN